MYNGALLAKDWNSMLTTAKSQIINSIDQAYDLWLSGWDDFIYGKTDAQIAAALSISEADVGKYKLGFDFIRDMYAIVHGTQAVPSPYNFAGKIAPF